MITVCCVRNFCVALTFLGAGEFGFEWLLKRRGPLSLVTLTVMSLTRRLLEPVFAHRGPVICNETDILG